MLPDRRRGNIATVRLGHGKRSRHGPDFADIAGYPVDHPFPVIGLGKKQGLNRRNRALVVRFGIK